MPGTQFLVYQIWLGLQCAGKPVLTMLNDPVGTGQAGRQREKQRVEDKPGVVEMPARWGR